MIRLGIDVSRWQGEIDFNRVKKNGIDFVIIKAGGSDAGFYTDRYFESNYRKAKEAGLFVGAYYFVGRKFLSAADGVADAKRFLKMLEGKQFEYPVVLDIESTPKEQRRNATTAAIEFCRTLELNGYYVSIYGSDISTFCDRLELQRLNAFDKWVARYGADPSYVKNFGMWQFTSGGNVAGILGNVDMDYSYKDYPTIMKENNLNGY